GVYVVDSKAGPSVPPGTSGSRRTSFVRFINTSSSRVTFYSGSGTPISVEPGNIARIVGGGEGTKGDGGAASSAVLIGASDVVVTSNGTIFVTDVGQKSVRRVDPVTGIINSLSVGAAQYTGLGLDAGGRLHIANYDSSLVLRETAAGSGSFSTLATGLSRARDVAVDTNGVAYVTVSPPARASGNHQIAQVSSSGAVTVVAGGTPGFSGDDGPAAAGRIRISPSELVVGSGTTNQLPQTVSIAVGPNNELIFTDSNNNRIRRLSRNLLSCERTGTITIVGANPTPQLTGLSPAAALQNSGAFTLTIDGTGFVTGAEVRWNGSARVTTFVSATRLTAAITSADLATAGTVNVTVSNPAPGGGLSSGLPFTITAPNPLPQLTGLNPATAVQGSGGFTLTVNGSGFVDGAIIRWDGQNRATTFVSANQLTTQIPAGDLAGAGTAVVTVVNPTPGGGISNSLNFTITSPANPTPSLATISPTSVISGSSAFTLTVSGGGFISLSKVEVNGIERVTTYQSPTQLTAAIPASDIAVAGTLQVAVRTPSPGGGVTSTQPLRVVPPAALLTGLNPERLIAGDPAFNLSVSGIGFVNGAVVRINGRDRVTTYGSPTQLLVSVPATDIATAGNLAVVAVNPGSPESNSLTLPVYIRVTPVSSASYAAGDQAPNSIIAAFGLNLATGVEVNTAATLPTTLRGTRLTITDSAGVSRDQSLFFVAPSQINFHLHPSTALGPATLTVRIDNNIVGLGQLQVGSLVPAIFTQNANGEGVPAAYALRYRGPDVSLVPILSFDNAQSKWVPVPIDLGPEGDIVFLVLFGTGFRSNSGLAGTTITIRSTAITPVYAGPAPDFIGLDQMNIQIPRSLIGAGLVNMQISVDGKVANPTKVIQLNIK
ncbi:MAG: IPT/TIG domain-containing protein, partial [Blastocatellia bacterium]